MGKAFIIPDVHLKPWMFERADELMRKGEYDHVVCLGDLVDDWEQELNLELYEETLDAAAAFAGKHPEMLFCYGNHDVSYRWEALESGYSYDARDTVLKGFEKLKRALPYPKMAFIHRIDNTLFSHAGLVELFAMSYFSDRDYDIDEIIREINDFDIEELWQDISPIWARPQDGFLSPYGAYLQVVGHTPVREPVFSRNFLTLDTFSTMPDGRPIGDERFVWVDTVEKTWGYADQ